MNLAPRRLVLKSQLVKDRQALAVDTGFAADSFEGIRLVKASRGTGWFYHDGQLRPWNTSGVFQQEGRLVVWGELAVPEGASPAQWPQHGAEGRDFLRAFVEAWTARAAAPEPLQGFGPSAVLPWLTEQGWAFAFLPDELRSVLDSLQPLSERLSWDHYRQPEADGAASWAFASAALGLCLYSGTFPWAQEDEPHLRQEMRGLKRTLSRDELPDGLDAGTLALWFDALTGRGATPGQWRSWLAQGGPSEGPKAAETDVQRREAAKKRRDRRRGQAAFWRRRGTVVTAVASGAAIVLFVAGSIVWGIIKPDPTDTWTQNQVVAGYYAAVNSLDSEAMRKLTSFDSGKEPELARDQEEATNLYVIRQVRTAYEHQSPIVDAAGWEAAGKPPVEPTAMLYGLAGLAYANVGDSWTVTYRKWASESGEDKVVKVTGFSVVDQILLKHTGRGWKISSLHRERQPLP